MLTCLVPVLFTFYIQGVLKLKKNNSGANGLITYGLFSRKLLLNCVHIYSVGRFHEGVLYFQTSIKPDSTSLNVPDVFYCHSKSNAFPAPSFMKLTNERQSCAQISYIGFCPNRIINVDRMSKALLMLF